jgi:hypothetical protein
MAKFTGQTVPVPTAMTSPIATSAERVLTHEEAPGYALDARSALVTLAVVNMVGEDTFYEGGSERDARFRSLIAEVTHEDPKFVAGLVPWLRRTANMRSASIVTAVEYVLAGGPNGRAVVRDAIARADEPAETLAYTLSRTGGRRIPAAIKRAVADACTRFYTDRNQAKYDGTRSAWRFADVLNLVHPTPNDGVQDMLWARLCRDRHGQEQREKTRKLVHEAFYEMPEADRRAHLDIAAEGLPWEMLAGWVPGGMDAAAWEALIPSLGYMALIRNLRNFDEQKISDTARARVCARIADADEVARSRQFPYRLLSAYAATPAEDFRLALARAIPHAVQNVPTLDGSTLVLIDTSGSMQQAVSNRSTVARAAVAGLFGAVVALRWGNVKLGVYAQGYGDVIVPAGISPLRLAEQIVGEIGRVGHSTMLHTAIAHAYTGQDRVIVFTDDQAHDSPTPIEASIPAIYTFDLAGYGRASAEQGSEGRHRFAGFSDAMFRVIPILESGRSVGWDALIVPPDEAGTLAE